MHALLKHVELWLADVHLVVHSEKAFTSSVEWFEAHWLKLKVLGVATEHIECLFLCLFRMKRIMISRVASFLKPENFSAALVKVDMHENQVL